MVDRPESIDQARHQLEDALVELDLGYFGARSEGEILGDWIVVYAHTDVSQEDMPLQLTQVTSGPGWPRHKQIGFLREALLYLEAEVTAEVIADRPD